MTSIQAETRSLCKKTAFVTGGTGAIGWAICKELARRGADVAFTFLQNEDKAKKLKGLLEEKGCACKSYRMDVTDRDEVREVLNSVKDAYGGLDILVNNAGINMPQDLDRITDHEWDRVLAVNLKGPFICIQEAIPILNDNASIINIGSVSGQYGGPRTAHYAASKAGLISLGQVAARFLAHRGIRSNTLSAGLISTDMAAHAMSSPAVKTACEQILLKRMGTPEEVAAAVAFLASDDSSYITAQTINLNGGLYF